MEWQKRYATTIYGLIDYFGGMETVARILNVTIDDLHLWAEGRAAPPPGAFRIMVDSLNPDLEGRAAEQDDGGEGWIRTNVHGVANRSM
jgi:hypothetical protein